LAVYNTIMSAPATITRPPAEALVELAAMSRTGR